MHDQDDIWRKRFQEPLDDQDWLETSDKLFDSIEEQVYGKEERKRRLWFLPLFFVGALMAVGSIIWIYNNSKAKIIEQETQSLSLIDKKENQEKRSSEQIFSEEPVQNVPLQDITADRNRTESFSNVNEVELPSLSSTVKSTINTSRSEGPVSAAFNLGDNTTSVLFSSETTDSNSRAPLLGSGQSSAKLTDESGPEPLNDIPGLARLTSQITNLRRERLSLDNMSLSEISQKSSVSHYRNQLRAGIAIGFWQYGLNNNFASAVQPADFRYQNGQSYGIGLAYQKRMGERLSLLFHLGVDQVAFTSGHNSAYDYDVLSETSNSQGVPLTMATPLGFIEGSVIITRTGAIQADNESLVLDLHNDHRYKAVSLDAGVGYDLLSAEGFKLGARIGFGVQQLFDLQNELSLVNIDNSRYASSNYEVIADQTTINKLLPFGLSGVDLTYDFNTVSALGFSYDYGYSLRPIHQQGDLSTGMARHQFRLYYGYSF